MSDFPQGFNVSSVMNTFSLPQRNVPTNSSPDYIKLYKIFFFLKRQKNAGDDNVPLLPEGGEFIKASNKANSLSPRINIFVPGDKTQN